MWRHELNGNCHHLTGYALGVIIESQAEATRTSAISQEETLSIERLRRGNHSNGCAIWV